MRLFSFLYEKVMGWARHRHAPWYLGALSFAESSFFPIPPDAMLAPMSLARPQSAWRYALLTTVCSVLGGLLGYLLGMFLFELVSPLLLEFGYWPKYQQAVQWFERWGFWAIFLAGFSPIPYKIFTVTAGAIAMAWLPFLIASVCGRGARFFLVAGLIRWGGARMEVAIRRNVEWLGWGMVILLAAAYLLLR